MNNYLLRELDHFLNTLQRRGFTVDFGSLPVVGGVTFKVWRGDQCMMYRSAENEGAAIYDAYKALVEGKHLPSDDDPLSDYIAYKEDPERQPYVNLTQEELLNWL